MFLEVIAFVEKEFPDAILKIDSENKIADVFIDCLKDKNFEVTLDVRDFGVRIGKLNKSLELGDFSRFEYSFSNIEEVKRFLFNCKENGNFNA